VKNATGCTVVRSSRLPSTRQYTRPQEPASPELCLDESKFVVNRNCRVSDEAPVSPKITIVNNYVQRTKLRLHSGGPSSTRGRNCHRGMSGFIRKHYARPRMAGGPRTTEDPRARNRD
jgi:hypothetical protein